MRPKMVSLVQRKTNIYRLGTGPRTSTYGNLRHFPKTVNYPSLGGDGDGGLNGYDGDERESDGDGGGETNGRGSRVGPRRAGGDDDRLSGCGGGGRGGGHGDDGRDGREEEEEAEG